MLYLDSSVCGNVFQKFPSSFEKDSIFAVCQKQAMVEYHFNILVGYFPSVLYAQQC